MTEEQTDYAERMFRIVMATRLAALSDEKASTGLLIDACCVVIGVAFKDLAPDLRPAMLEVIKAKIVTACQSVDPVVKEKAH